MKECFHSISSLHILLISFFLLQTPPQVGKTKSGLFGFLSGKKSKKGSPTGGAFPSKEGKMKADRVKQNDIKPTHSSDRSV